jgi:hypothetical protein
MVFPVVGGDGKPTGYDIDNSLRFEDGDSPELTFTPSSAGTQTKFTISLWFKLGNITSTRRVLFGAGDDYLRLADDDNIQWHVTDNGGTGRSFYTSAKIRDPSAWYHVVALWDTTQGTDTNRMRLWTNGVEQTANSFTRPSQNATSQTLNSAAAHKLGGELNPGNDFHFDGYISEFYFIDGYAYDYQDFGEFDDNGVWIPKDFTGSYGSNGIRLEFKQTGTSANSSGIGADTSGNDNHMSVTNLAATDVTTDTPTNNFCTLNPLYQQGSNTFSEGNCKVVLEAGDGSKGVAGGIAPANGKWYWEVKQGSATNSSILVREASDKEDDLSYYQGNFAGYVFNNGNQNITGNTNSTYGPSYSSGDIIMVAMDMDNDRVYFGKNGSWIDGEGNADEANINDFVPLNGVTNGLGAFANANGSATATAEFNWGNPSFSISSGNADANGYGNFEYAVPSGFYSLCTKNLAEYG